MPHLRTSDLHIDKSKPHQFQQYSLWAGAFAAFAITFAYRWLTINFTNDQFVHLSRARQILLGDVPVRDFFDPGLFLQYYASAAALYLSGGTLLGEAVLTIFFTSLGAALLYVMATRLSRSWLIGAAATAAAVATFPRLYNYPKVFLFVLAIACAWRYSVRPTRARLSLMAAATALAFLFRHDHGVYIGLAGAAFLALLHWLALSERSESKGLALSESKGLRPLVSSLGVYAGVTTLLILPFLVFVQSVAGIRSYIAGLSSQAQEITTVRVNAPPFRFDWTKPFIHVDPPTEQRVSVRWKEGITDVERRAREHDYGLTRPIFDVETTWSYVITDIEPYNISMLVKDPLVDDTNGIDRERFELSIKESLFRRAQRAMPVLRTQIAPGVLTFDNALAWLYYMTLGLPAVAAATMIVRRRSLIPNPRSPIPDPRSAGETAIAGMLIVLCLVIGQSLLREQPETRLPDVAVPMALLGAWVVGAWTRRDMRCFRARIAATLAVGIVTIWGATAFGETGDHIVTSGVLGGPAALKERFDKTNEYLTTTPPIDAWNDKGSIALRALAEWVRRCTVPSDRLLLVGWAPDVYFYAERPFAGGQVYLYPKWHSSAADQQLTVRRLEQQRVPIAIVPVEGQPATRQAFPIVMDYVNGHFTHVMRANFDSPVEYDVLVRRDISPVGMDDTLRLPCYR